MSKPEVSVQIGACSQSRNAIGIQFVRDGDKYVARGCFIPRAADTAAGAGVTSSINGQFYTAPTFRCKRCEANYLYQCAVCNKFVCYDGTSHAGVVCPSCGATISVAASPQSRIVMRSGLCPDVLLAIDVSGSMNEYNRIDQVKRAAIDTIVRPYRNKCRMGIVTFASGAHVVLPMCEDFARIESTINGLSAGGGTVSPFHCVRVDAELRAFRESTAPRYLVVFTDGEWSGDKSGHINSATALRDSGITIIAIGCAGAKEDFLRSIATPGAAISVSDSDIHGGFASAADSIFGQG